eukprot:TRINITY_DN57976_c0_g1_i1.p1 TRINITY_DN57976_c0_g1~~TRINITY_DN57976_c0_g1_i1.p1  ORF type:complete len:333 (-),score=39.77 TRINITY_DN57976_c0_g1_i1:470-1468(-)
MVFSSCCRSLLQLHLVTCLAHQWPAGPDLFPSPPAIFDLSAQFVVVEPDIHLYVLERTGYDKSLSPLVFIHGLGDSWHSWEKIMPSLDTSRRIIAYDIRGHGNSSKPRGSKETYSMQKYSEDLRALLDVMEVQQIGCLVGHSWGAMIGQHFAGVWPDRVERLLLIGTTMEILPATRKVIEASLPTYRQISNISYEVAVQENTGMGDFDRSIAGNWFFETLVHETMQCPPHVFLNILENVEDIGADTMKIIGSITAKTVLLWGEACFFAQVSACKRMLNTLKPTCNASMSIIKDEGHCPNWTPRGSLIVAAHLRELLAEPASVSVEAAGILIL